MALGGLRLGFGLDLASGSHLLRFWLDFDWIWLDFGLDFELSFAFIKIFIHSRSSHALRAL